MKTPFSAESCKFEFDRENPRLAHLANLQNASDYEIVTALVSEADIEELVVSIISNHYINIEPLIVTKKNVSREGNFRVLEGNRRLAAIRLIQDPEFAKKCRLSVPKEISESVLKSLDNVLVYEVDDEVEARGFIGFKHINGAHRWGSFAKAKYLTNWYKSQDISIDVIAQQLGDHNSTVRNLIGGMLVLLQAEDRELFKIEDRTKVGPFGFSHLYTALGRIEYREFLGLDRDWNIAPSENPISQDSEPKLGEVLKYIYGNKSEDFSSVIHSQNPDLKRLGQVLSKPLALQILRSTKNLDKAYEEFEPSAKLFSDKLVIANQRVRDTIGIISKFDTEGAETLFPIAEEMLDNSDSIVTLMSNKIKKKTEES